MLILLAAACALAAAAFLAAEWATQPARARATAVRRAATYGRVRLRTKAGEESFRERVAAPLVARLARWALRLNPRATVESVGARLRAAGLARTLTPTGFLALKMALVAGGAVGGAAFGASVGGAAGALMFALVAGVAGFTVPDFLLSSRAKARQEAVRAELPDALDLLAVSVEAGLGFDGAIAKLTEHTDGALAQEFGLALNEMRIGESRQDALRRMVDRVPAPELAAFVRALIQADQLGISLGRILRVQAADSRLRRQAAAEERAMKAPIKMLFPTVLFIFPAIFIVVLGPAVLNILEAFE